MSFSTAELGETIRKAREARQWSRIELAGRAGIGKTAMFDLEHGNPGVRLNTLLSVLRELEMDLELIHPEPAAEAAAEAASADAPAPAVSESLPEHLL